MNRQTLATAQVLPAITRQANLTAQAHALPSTEVMAQRSERAAKLAKQSAPMYEGYMGFVDIYLNNLAIMGCTVNSVG